MGVIASQSLKRGLVYLTGVIIGAFSVMFVYPLSKEVYGFIQFLISTSVLISMFYNFGITGVLTRYYPEFKDDVTGKFQSIILSLLVCTITVFTTVMLVFKSTVLSILGRVGLKIYLLEDNFHTILMIAVLYIFIQTLTIHSANYKKIVIPALISELSFKIFLPLLVVLYFYDVISMSLVAKLIIGFYVVAVILIIYYLNTFRALKLGKSSILSLKASKRKEIFSYMSFSGLNLIGDNLSSRIDNIMIPMILSLQYNGVYSIFLFMSSTLYLPTTAIFPIANPIITDSLQRNDMENVKSIYQKSSINSLLIGGFLFLLMWFSIDDIVSLMPSHSDILPFTRIFIFLGLAKLIDMGTSINSPIIIYSKYYRWNLFFLMFLAVVNILLNYYLLNKVGLVGASIATFTSIALYNLLKLFFIKVKFGFYPFTNFTFRFLVLFIVILTTVHYIPQYNNHILNILFKSILIIILFITLIKVLRIKADILEIANKQTDKILKFRLFY